MEEETQEQREDSDGASQGESEAKTKAEEHKKADEEAEETVKALEDDPPESLDDWPDDQAKYKTFGGPDSETGYSDGATANLGEADVRYHEDGAVSVGGEKVDNPEDYKGDPIPGGPTDPNSPKVSGEQDLTKEGSAGESGDDDSESGGDDSDSKDD